MPEGAEPSIVFKFHIVECDVQTGLRLLGFKLGVQNTVARCFALTSFLSTKKYPNGDNKCTPPIICD